MKTRTSILVGLVALSIVFPLQTSFADHVSSRIPVLDGPLNEDDRQILFHMPVGAHSVEIIGTSVIPEFGTVVLAIFVAGMIGTIILFSQNKFMKKVELKN